MWVSGLCLLVHGVAVVGLAAVAGEALDSPEGFGTSGFLNGCRQSAVFGRSDGTQKCSAAMLQSRLAINANSVGSGSQVSMIHKTNASKAEQNASIQGKRLWERSRRSFGALVRNAKVFSGHCNAHTFSLQRAMERLKESHIPTNNEFDSLIAHFINQQAASQDKCPVQLMQAKKQLEALHVMVTDLSAEINTSEVQIQTTTTSLQNVHTEQEENDQILHEETIVCEKKTAEDKKLYAVLQQELLELQQLANAHSGHFDPNSAVDEFVKKMSEHGGDYTINYTSGMSDAWTGSTSYQEFPAPALYWRVANAHPSTERPYIKSFSMYSDFDCKIPVVGGQPICSGMMGGANACFYTMHGANTTRWLFECDQCQKGEAWVGVKLVSPAPVKCVHVAGTLGGKENHGLLLETSNDGTSWSVVSDVSNTDTVVVLQGQTSPHPQQQTAALASSRQTGGFVALQEDAVPLRAATNSRAKAPRRPTEKAVKEPRLLAKKTKALAKDLMTCLAQTKGGHAKKVEQTKGVSLLEVFPTLAPGIDQCEEQKHILQITYSRAYVDLSRVVSQYAKLVVDTSCIGAATETHKQRDKPLSTKVEELSTRLTTQTTSLQSYRSRVESATRAEVKLRILIITLTHKCAAMEETEDSLDKIRDAIHVLDLCPGLYNTVNFSIPVWTGGWVQGNFDLKAMTDAQVDAEMNALCAQLRDEGMKSNPRAAETSEIEQRTVENAPERNTAPVPLMGTCPGCEGDPNQDVGEEYLSGHARVCWDPDVMINENNRRTDCGMGHKAVMCVLD